MAIQSGTVAVVSHKFDKFSLLLEGNDTWYSTKFNPNPEPVKGDVVSFDDGGKKYINKLAIEGGGAPRPTASSAPAGGAKVSMGGFPVDPLARERSIIRQNALAHATNVVTSFDPKGTTVDEMAKQIVAVAKYFETYSAGDMDREEAEGLAKAAGKLAE
jgi:hypothetical protein